MEPKATEDERRTLMFGPKFLIFSVVVIVLTLLLGIYSGELQKYNDGIPNDVATEVDTTKTK